MRIRLDFHKPMVDPISLQDVVRPSDRDSLFEIDRTAWRDVEETTLIPDGRILSHRRPSAVDRFFAELVVAGAITDAVVELLCDEEEAEQWKDCLFVAISDELRVSPDEFDAFELVIRAMTRLFATATDRTIPSKSSHPKTVVSKYKAPYVAKPRFHRKGDRDNGMCLRGMLPLQSL